MAPEILITKPYNELTDIWSLGIIAYELAIGENPYQGMTLNRIIICVYDVFSIFCMSAHGQLIIKYNLVYRPIPPLSADMAALRF